MEPVKAAMPPFNRRPDMKTFETTVEYNAPVFGPAISKALMAIFEGDEMKALAATKTAEVRGKTLSQRGRKDRKSTRLNSSH